MTVALRRLSIVLLLGGCSPGTLSQFKIVGGSPVPKELYDGQYRSIGSLQWGVIHRCGATLISPTRAVTAAHCVVAFTQEQLQESASIVFGSADLEDEIKANLERIAIESVRVHPDYDPKTFHNDIAILELKTPSRQTPALANTEGSFPEAGSEVHVAGWGEITEGGYRPSDLRHTQLAVVDEPRCQDQLSSSHSIFKESICAYGISTDACHGDSGGPLYSFANDEIKLVGIVSWGIGCGLTLPAVYTRVSSYDLAGDAGAWPIWN